MRRLTFGSLLIVAASLAPEVYSYVRFPFAEQLFPVGYSKFFDPFEYRTQITDVQLRPNGNPIMPYYYPANAVPPPIMYPPRVRSAVDISVRNGMQAPVATTGLHGSRAGPIVNQQIVRNGNEIPNKDYTAYMHTSRAGVPVVHQTVRNGNEIPNKEYTAYMHTSRAGIPIVQHIVRTGDVDQINMGRLQTSRTASHLHHNKDRGTGDMDEIDLSPFPIGGSQRGIQYFNDLFGKSRHYPVVTRIVDRRRLEDMDEIKSPIGGFSSEAGLPISRYERSEPGRQRRASDTECQLPNCGALTDEISHNDEESSLPVIAAGSELQLPNVELQPSIITA